MRLFLFILSLNATAGEIILSERLEPYVARFKAYASDYWPVTASPLPASRWDGLTIEIAEVTSQNADGECRADHGKRTITLDSEWIRYTEERKESVLFHELGHCVLGLDHDNRKCGDRPCSIMNSSAPGTKNYGEHKSQYLEDLFMQGANQLRKETE